ncbi:MAG: site-specific DNA-methyltransferase [Armatimonadetes bacterium]|nr:site-specific DNA-methyltransferase [Armatimonadota bacterium]MDW8121147.1 site-specific DNA-methyltransferase [Armatimonadota bacterium]
MKGLDTIILGDALETLRDLPQEIVDVTITSPPYNKGEKNKGWLVDKIVYQGATDIKDEKTYQKEQIAVLNEIYRLTKKGGSLFYNHKLRWYRGQMIHPYEWVRQSRWVIRQEIIWHRRIAANLRGWRFWQVDERIFWLYKPRNQSDRVGPELKPRHALLTSVWEIPPERDDRHPNPFPIELPTRCIFSVLDGNKGVVLDPYCGIGTTLVAAVLLGCHFIGIDISPVYVTIARERIRDAEKERDRVQAELSLHKVQKTFEERKREGRWVGRFSPLHKPIVSPQQPLPYSNRDHEER